MATPEEIFRSLYRIRRAEEEIARAYPTDKIQSPVHLSIGQELASVAVCAALRPEDKVFGSYRGHALYLAKGGNLRAFVAELYGKATGCAKGKGGSMHLVSAEAGLLGCSAIVGQLIPVAVGYAWAQKLQGTGVVTAVFFGDGATEEGVYFEALNLAALHKLPILFVCENNGYAIVTPIDRRQVLGAVSSTIVRKANSFGVHGRTAGVNAVIRDAASAVERVRDGYGPEFLEILSTREREHVGPNEDWGHGYRTKEDGGPDPVAVAAEAVALAAAARIRDEVEAEIADAFAFAEASPFPAPADLMADTYAH